MHHHSLSTRSRRALGGAAVALVLVPVLALSGCASSPGEAAAAAAAKPLSQAAFITRQLGLSSADFGAYLHQQSVRLTAGTSDFVAAYEAGDDELARALYAPTRSFYNRMLAAAPSFAELDAALDGPGTGWHAAEADLFGGASGVDRSAVGAALNADTAALERAVAGLRPSVDEQAAGVAALMAGRATAAASGSAEPASHTDLYDLQAHVDSSREVFSGLRPILVTENAALATTLDHRFDAVEAELNTLRTGVAFPGFDTLDEAQRASLASAVADLTESLGEVPGTLTD
ncbi:EfeM/EfeO family lipoprotein [Subtercola sp. Z020]|uniref:EfeM/EfeO family lipoprotein n=1 Tax=Subtercola sp. Z020 TaxID=2080582 RepID=UPI00130DC26C|nr:EfeM/EfeO family lipoprotein [Subtercola sp. Z020]